MIIRIEFDVDIYEEDVVNCNDAEEAIEWIKELINMMDFNDSNYRVNKSDIAKIARVFIDTHEELIVE